jgi:hypothetical protein
MKHTHEMGGADLGHLLCELFCHRIWATCDDKAALLQVGPAQWMKIDAFAIAVAKIAKGLIAIHGGSHLFHLVIDDVGIDHRGGERGVAEGLLHQADVFALAVELCCVAATTVLAASLKPRFHSEKSNEVQARQLPGLWHPFLPRRYGA